MKTFLKTTLAGGLAATLLFSAAMAQELAPLNSDTEKDRIDWSQLDAKLGPLPKPAAGTKAGAVSKTLTNEYWRSLGDGYKKFGEKMGVSVAYQAAQSEGDQLGQLTIAEGLITQGFNVLLVSPQTDANLQPVMEQAKAANVPVVNVNDAVIPQAEHYVGNVQRDNGARVAKWFIENRPEGGKVAIVEGQAGVYAAVQRTDGFKSTITQNGKFQVVASVPGNWDRQTSYDAATNILQQHPDLIGFYANNDGMALGIVEAVKSAGLQGKVAVFGTDGISDAYKSIKDGELTGTVDSFPVLTGEVSLETALRLVAGQKVPRVVATPQALITKDNIARYQGDDTAIRAVLMEDAAKAP
ncbi:substrate-binding domain-containing protein [Rhizobium sp. VS19-DR104.2]|uniref:sugar ABC transporter substrate-binding protein n=1 Tax=unclassified Rhizobium TaxID=2613769 RepID=UPI001CC7964D|nr:MULTISPECIES: substrate-binding domain-containing protein [unclassified Rhizobium]MBZ5762604.1 substrate-binding domain-containing protein [Rhizobium sp. VS19-DR96]MBZ5768082.1 substrate-binding domain-containing protein [Rhizobium sp. VS19-DR129.2]MBZ5775548.1 substrate-binding domain-containing protein [Rhizobium sp. VS19-DRK62.2]MBZ5787334.1 substrate-binding domain-containing protein [Rhizobium sp. VS19-DR121]MBZ5804008.1 substrate-binding domain-containing protein [Rhizobium sp. VS19-D